MWGPQVSQVKLDLADLADQMVLVASKGHQVQLETLVILDPQEQLVHLDQLERLAVRVLKDLPGHREVQGTVELQAHLERLGTQEHLDFKDHRELPERVDLVDRLG